MRDYLASLTNDDGKALCEIIARDREVDQDGNDPVHGDYQTVTAVEPVHELLRKPGSAKGHIEFFPVNRSDEDLRFTK